MFFAFYYFLWGAPCETFSLNFQRSVSTLASVSMIQSFVTEISETSFCSSLARRVDHPPIESSSNVNHIKKSYLQKNKLFLKEFFPLIAHSTSHQIFPHHPSPISVSSTHLSLHQITPKTVFNPSSLAFTTTTTFLPSIHFFSLQFLKSPSKK